MRDVIIIVMRHDQRVSCIKQRILSIRNQPLITYIIRARYCINIIGSPPKSPIIIKQYSTLSTAELSLSSVFLFLNFSKPGCLQYRDSY